MKVLLIDQIAKVNYKYSFSLVNALNKQTGITVTLAMDTKEENENCDAEKYRLFNTADKNIGKLKKVWNYIYSVREICKIAERSYDVIHSQWIIFSPVDYMMLRHLKKRGKKIVLTIHDILPFNQKFYDYYYHKKIYAMADQIIVQATDNVKRFHELFPDNQVPVHMIPHGHFMDYAQKVEKNVARERLQIPQDKFVYLFFGQIKKVKGVDVLLKAWAKAIKEKQELKENALLVIAGSVWKADFGKCEEIIETEHLQEYLKLDIRYIPDEEVDSYYGAADICVLPYLEVYQSGVLQLTYAHDKAAIVTKIPAFTDIINESRGFLCEPGDADSLKEAMERAYDEKDMLKKKADHGYTYIKERFDWDKIAVDIARLYQS